MLTAAPPPQPPTGYWYYKSPPHVAYHQQHPVGTAYYAPQPWPTQMHVQQAPHTTPSRRRLFVSAPATAASEFVSQAAHAASHQVAAARLLALQLLQATSPVGVALKTQLLEALTVELQRQRAALTASQT